MSEFNNLLAKFLKIYQLVQCQLQELALVNLTGDTF